MARWKRITAAATLAAVMAAATLAEPAGAGEAASGELRGKPKEHEVAITWRPIAVDFRPNSKRQYDKFSTEGKPLGDGKIVTKVSRKSGERIKGDFRGKDRRGTYSGLIDLERTIIKTTETKQVAEYRGEAVYEYGTGRYEDIVGFIKVGGRTTCTANGCTGQLELAGDLTF